MRDIDPKLKLAIARSDHVMTPLSDTTFLVTGGVSSEEKVLGAAEVLDLGARGSRVIDSRHLPRVGHSCVKLTNGKILLIGGRNDKHIPEARIEKFDPTTRSFSVIGQLAVARDLQQAVLLPDGKVFVCGGVDAIGNALNSVELIDPVTGGTTELHERMFRKRYHHQAVLLESGLVLITGGAGDPESKVTAEIFDATKRVFLPEVTMHQQRVIHTATPLDDGRVFVFSNGVGEVFSPRTGKFDQVAGFADPAIRDGHTATLLIDGDVLIVGGGIPEFEEEVLGAPVVFRPRANSYLELKVSNELVNRSEHAAVRLPNGDVLLTGGRTVHSPATDDVVIYDFATRQFR